MRKFLLFTLIGVVLLGGVAPLIATISVDAQEAATGTQQPSEETDAQQQQEGKPKINLQSGRNVSTNFTGTANLTYALSSGQAQPLAMASDDFDGDGAADLVVGYSSSAGTGVVLYRGNIEATAPRKQASIKAIAEGRPPQPFLPNARVFGLVEAPNFIGTGDFNGDGRLDVLAAARGSNALYLLAGDIREGFKPAERTDVMGRVTTLLVADVNRTDGRMDIVVGIEGAGGPAVLVYQGEGGGGALSAEAAVYQMPAEPTAIAVGQLDDRGAADLAVATGNAVVIIYGQGSDGLGLLSTLGHVGRMESINLPFNVRGLALGNFILDRDVRMEMAVLSDDGTTHVLKRGDLDMRPFTEEELKAREEISQHEDEIAAANKQAGVGGLAGRRPQWWTRQQGDTSKWAMAGDVAGTGSPDTRVAPQSLLIAARVSGKPGDDLMALDTANNKLAFLGQSQPEGKQRSQRAAAFASTSDAMTVAGAPIAALPMRLNHDGQNDLVVLQEGQIAPSTVTSVIAATFNVTRADDPLADGCAVNGCSLREALDSANAAAGVDTITFDAGVGTAGNPINITLLSGGFAGDNNNTRGDLDVRDGVIIMGNAGGTIIQAGTTKSTDGVNGNGIDRIFDINPLSDETFATTLTNLTLRNGKMIGSFGGAIQFTGFNANTGLSQDGTLTINNSTITDNLATFRGGGIRSREGLFTITNTSVTNNITLDGRGGGIDHRDLKAMDMTGCTVTGNAANMIQAGNGHGGGISLIVAGTYANAAAVPIDLIKSSNISNNTTDVDGGGIYAIAPIAISSPSTTTTINNNTAVRFGGGLYTDVDNESANGPGFFVDNTISGTTFKGNSAAQGGAIYHSRDKLTISNSTIGGTAAGEPNTTTGNGGGINNSFDTASGAGATSTGELILTNTAVVGNTATGLGGGIFNDDTNQTGTPLNAKVTITGGNITSNKANGDGGGLYNRANDSGTAIAILDNVTIKGNRANNDSSGGGDGGGIFNSGGTVTIGATTACIIGGTAAGEPNMAVNGGGIAQVGGTLTMSGGSINGNTATGNGGGISTSTNVTFTGVAVTNNSAVNGGGFAITGGTFGINGSATITGNTATTNGGGIHNNNGTVNLPNGATIGGAGALRNLAVGGGGIFNQAGTTTMTGGSLTGNQASGNGGGANVSGGTLTFASGVSITNNTTTGSGNGGGLAGTGGTINVNGGGLIRGNTAAGNGGGIHNNGSTILLPNATTIGGAGALRNMAANGGGIASVTGSLTMTGGTITGNQSSGDGAGVHHAGGTTNISNATITTNAASSEGGAFYNNGVGLTANLNRIISNSATGGGTGIFNLSGTPNMENNWWGCDGFPNTGGCETAAGPSVNSVDSTPRVDLVLTATPSTINPGGTSTLKADFSKNSDGTTINPVVMNGLTVTFASDSLGSVAPTSGTIASLMATTTYTAGPNAGLSTVTAQVDNPPAASTQITIQANADLAVTKTDNPDQVLRNGNITYTINFINNGPTNDPDVTVTDAVPTNTTLVSASITSGTGWTRTDSVPVGGTGNIVFSNPNVPNGGAATFEIVVKVNANAPIGATITNNATAAGFPVDPVPGNNTGTATSTVISIADLAVTKSDSPDPVASGANITYTINFTNNGPDPADNVTVTDAVPANTTLVSAVVTTGTGWSRTDSVPAGGTGNIVFSKNPVPAAETAVFTIVVKVNSNVAAGITISNSATVASPTTDPDSNNNTSATTTTTKTEADLSVTKSDSPDPVVAGNNITYTVTLTNNGPSDAQGVTLKDTVPANTTLVSASTPGGWTRDDSIPAGGTGELSYSKATVAASEAAIFTIVVKVGASTADGATITNNATAATTTTDPTPGNNTGTATTTVNRQSDLAVTKSDSPDPVIAGQNITYTIDFTNNGPSDASTVTVTDAVPANTTFVSATFPAGWSRSDSVAVGGTGNIVFAKSDVANGETAQFQLVVKVDTSAAQGSTITNNAVAASASADPNSGNSTGTATTSVNAQADLSVTKSDSPDPVVAGSNITYAINFANNGSSDAQSVTVTDAVPANTTLVSATVTTGTGWSRTDSVPAGGTGNIVFSKASVAAAETAVFEIVVNVNTNTAHNATITNSATAASTTTDPDNSNNTGTTTTTVVNQADLAVTKSDTPDPVVAGGNITYTINFANNGPGGANNVTVTDAVPANTTLVSAAVTTGTGWSRTDSVPAGGTGNIVFSKASVANGETAVFTIVVKVNSNVAAGSTITNSATAASTTTDPDSSNNTGTATTTTATQADIAVTKTDSPDPVVAGTDITYTVTLTNNGPSDAQGVTLKDTVPANTTLVSASTPGGWTRDDSIPAGGTGELSYSKATVAASETAVFTIVVKVNANVASGTVITNSATGATTTTDSDSGNNTGTATTTVSTLTDLSVTKSDTPDPVIAGQDITYTINFANNGPSDASTVTVTDAVPANTTLVSAVVTTGTGWSRTDSVPAGGTGNIVFSKASVANGETAVFTIVVKVNANAASGSTITNSAVAASMAADPDSSNNTGTTTTTVNTQADLAVTKTDSPDPVNSGSNITYTINFANNGSSDAQSVTVTDAVPANTTLVSATVTTGTGWSRTDSVPAGGTGNIVFSKASVAAAETAVFEIVVNVDVSTANNATITNSATAASTTTDPDHSNNTGTATTTVVNQADIAVTKSDSPDPVNAGGDITYTINFANNGPGGANNVTVTDAVPANTTLVSAVVTTGTGWSRTDSVPAGGTGNIVFSKASVANGETAVFTIVVKVNSNVAAGSTITNSATAATTTVDPDSSNNTGTATTTTATQADIAVTKTDSPDPVVAGTDITYTVTLTNNGPSDAQGVTLKDTVPANTTLVSASTPGGWTRDDSIPAGGTGELSYSKATVAAGETAVFTIVVKVNANMANGSTITNSAVGSSSTTDPDNSNNTGTSLTTVGTSADLSATKTDSPDPVIAGQDITYTINFGSNGPSDAQSVTVTDAVPANTTLVSAVVTTGTGWSRTDSVPAGGTGNIVFSKASVANGETAVFTIVVKVNANAASGSTITNSAVAASTTTDPDSSNNTGTTTTTVNTQADLAVTKTDSPDPVGVGGNITYTITITDNGPSDAQGLQLSDTLPANTTLVSVTVPAGWTRTDSVPAGGTGTITATAATLAAGASAEITIVVKVDIATPNMSVITNSASVTTTTTDPDSSNNTGTTTTTVAALPNLQVTKVDHADPLMVGENITYHINVKNNGPGNATGVVLTDRMPSSSIFVSASPPCTMANNRVTCNLGDLNIGAEASIDVVVKSTGNPDTIYDTASVASNETDQDAADNEVVESTRLVGFRQFMFEPGSVTAGCGNSTGRLMFTSGAPAGLVVNFTDNTNGIKPIPPVTTVGGEEFIDVTAATNLVAAEQIGIVTATAAGSNSIEARLRLLPVRIATLTLTPNNVTGGTQVTGTVTLPCAASQQIIVTLLSNKAVAKLNVARITFKPGETSKTFTITTKSVKAQVIALITARSSNGGFVRKNLIIKP